MESTGGCKALLLLLLLLTLRSASAFEIVETSDDAMVAQGGEIALLCRSDEPFEVCKWQHVESGKECRVASDSIDSATACKDDDHIEWALDGTTCGVRITGAARTDVGTYRCTMAVFGEERAVRSDEVDVDVAVPPRVEFETGFGGASIVADSDRPLEVECTAAGGYPKPDLQAFLGADPELADDDARLDDVPEMERETVHDDGTVTLSRVFVFVPTPGDCGKFVKCAAAEQLGGGSGDVATRKLVVAFPPKPFEREPAPFVFFEGDELLEVRLAFSANPVPLDAEAIWHVNPSGEDAASDSFVLSAGSSLDGKYESPPLNASGETGHEITATLVIARPTAPEAEYSYFLEVHNDKGSRKYEFGVLQAAELARDEPRQEGEGEPAAAMGSAVIAVIAVVVVVVILAVAVTVLAKRNHKLCFRYAQVPTKPEDVRPDAGSGRHEASIIKNGGGGRGQAVVQPADVKQEDSKV